MIITSLNGINLKVDNDIPARRFIDSHNSNFDVTQLQEYLVFLNGSILPTGDQRRRFDILPMKTALASLNHLFANLLLCPLSPNAVDKTEVHAVQLLWN